MSSLLTGETASNNYNVAKVFAGENANKEASAQFQRTFKPPSVVFPPMKIMKVKQVPIYTEINMPFGGPPMRLISGYKNEITWE
jgi:hypothetical protein